MSYPKVVVLMSVYNGEKYLCPQLDSIFAQKGVEVSLIVRDDGSQDNTVSILKSYATKFPLSILTGNNLGAARSFMFLVEHCQTDADFYAFSDADDVWYQEKLFNGTKILNVSGVGGPAMVVCKMSIVDKDLAPISLTSAPPKGFAFENSIVESMTSGAASILNKNAFRLIQERPPNCFIMHDSWIYLVVSAFGKVFYDMEPGILYRQHGSNVCGTNHGFMSRFKKRMRRLHHVSHCLAQAIEFNRLYGNSLDAEKHLILASYINYRDSFSRRIKYALHPTVFYQRNLANWYLRVLILCGKA